MSKAIPSFSSLWLLYLICGGALILPGPGGAAQPGGADSVLADPAVGETGDLPTKDLERVQAYFNGLTTLQARFQQFSSDGHTAEGTFYLKRPGRLRIDYDPPSPLSIIANGDTLFFHDTDLDSINSLPLDETPAAILLGETIDVNNGDVNNGAWHLDALTRGSATLRLTLSHREGKGRGQAILVFSERPLMLRKWHVFDPQGVETTVSLSDVRQDVVLDDALFVPPNPQALTNPFIR